MENEKCPKCDKGHLRITDEWDKEFDRLDKNVPAGDIIHDMLKNKGIHKFSCASCGFKKM